MIIYGVRRYVQTVATLMFLCGRCGNTSQHALRRFVAKITIFFVPLFPVHVRYEVQCSTCGHSGRVPRDQAKAMQEQAANPQGPYPQGPGQGQYGQDQYGQPPFQQPQYAPQQGPYPSQPQAAAPQQPYGQPAPALPPQATQALPYPPYQQQ